MYHYTDSRGIRGILSSGQLNESRGPGDCAHGEGVYGTSITPCAGGDAIRANTSGSVPHDGSMYYVKFRVPEDQVDRYQGWTSGGDHFVHRGPLDVHDATMIGKVGGGKAHLSR